MSKIYEIYDGPVSDVVTAVPPKNGYVTFVCVDSTNRRECMEQAVEAEMGVYDTKYMLGESSSRYLLQVCRVDGETTTVSGAAAAFSRAYAASEAGAGPPVIDGWLATFVNVSPSSHRTVYGFTLMLKPNVTLSEYVFDVRDVFDTDLDAYVKKSVTDVLPLLGVLFSDIADQLDFWPGPSIGPADIAFYIDNELAISKAVVTDWTSCTNGKARFRRIFSPFFENYKAFLDNVYDNNE